MASEGLLWEKGGGGGGGRGMGKRGGRAQMRPLINVDEGGERV